MLRNSLYTVWFVDDLWGFDIVDGDLKGYKFQIDSIDFKDSEAGNVQIEYTLITKPEDTSLSDESFLSETLQIVLNDILKEAIEISEHEQNRTNHTEESSPE